LVLFAFNFKAISYFLYPSDSSIAFIQDFDCEEKNESEKSDQKDKKKDISEYLFSNKIHTLKINRLLFTQQSTFLYASSDYSKAVYCPPDQTVC